MCTPQEILSGRWNGPPECTRRGDGLISTPIVALDFDSLRAALDIVDRLGERCRFYKVGSELFTAAGTNAIEELRARECQLFLDLKFHDIPNTVGRATAVAASLGASIVTVHAAGGAKMIQAAVVGAGSQCEVFAVTVLTSLDSDELSAVWGRDQPTLDMTWEVLRLAELARTAGAHGVVCSGHEAGALREHFGDTLQLLVPGVRLAGCDPGDQARVTTPADARRVGARYVILGRTITRASDPGARMDEAVASLR